MNINGGKKTLKFRRETRKHKIVDNQIKTYLCNKRENERYSGRITSIGVVYVFHHGHYIERASEAELCRCIHHIVCAFTCTFGPFCLL